MSGQLTLHEGARLAELEAVVQRGLATFAEVGRALLAIREERLYRETFETFETYLDDRWGISSSRGYQLMDAAVVSTMVEIQNERQARELIPVLRDGGAEAVAEVWQELHEEHGSAITAERIRARIEQRDDEAEAQSLDEQIAATEKEIASLEKRLNAAKLRLHRLEQERGA